MKRGLFLCMALVARSAPAFAAGLDLTWNDCAGSPNATSDKTFTCTGTVNENYDLVV